MRRLDGQPLAIPQRDLLVPAHIAEERSRQRVAIVGIGHIGPLGMYGTDAEGTKITEAWDNMKAGKNGIRLLTDASELFPNFAKYPNIETKLAGWVDKTDEELEDGLVDLGSVADLSFKSRCTLLTETSAKLALHDAKLMVPYALKRGIRTLTSFRVDPEIADEMAVIGGTGVGGGSDSIVEAQRELERKVALGEKLDPAHVFKVLPGGIEESATIENEIHGESYGVLGECATGGHTIITAMRAILAGDAVAAVCVNGESTLKEPVGVAEFDALGALTKGTDPERFPHSSDENNDGFGFAEGATTVVLMREDEAIRRGLHRYAIVVGWKATSDGSHPSFPREDGKYQKKAMDGALARAGKPPKDGVIYIRQHATGTKPPSGPSADAIEARVTRASVEDWLSANNDSRSFEDVVGGTSSLKPMEGHLLGADALTGVMAGALAIQDDAMPGNWKTERLLEESQRLNMIVNTTRRGAGTIMSLIPSFGFGGKNAVIVVEEKDLNSPT